MKKTSIFVILVTIALSWSCKKEVGKVHTTINGQLRTNGTEDVIKMPADLARPIVKLYHKTDGTDVYPDGYEEISSVTVDKDARYNFNIDLNMGDTYFIGFRNLYAKLYYQAPYDWNMDEDNKVFVGRDNTINLYCLAKSWIRPRFINSNSDANNQDVFEYRGGIGSLVSHVMGPYLYGSVDTTFSNALFKTWSGTDHYGIPKGHNGYYPHEVYGKLTRNGVTRDTSIIYTVPAYDTSVVIIRY